MSFAFIQSRSTNGTADLSLAYTSNVTASSLLVASVWWDSGSATCSVSDNVNGAWTSVGSPKTGVGGLSATRMQLYYKLVAAAGATTVTADVSSAVSSGLAIHEYSGTNIGVDGTPVYDTANGTSITTSAIVTTVASDLGFAACTTSGNTDPVGIGGYTIRERANYGFNASEDDTDIGAAGSKTTTFNLTGTTDNITGFIAFGENLSGAQNQIAWITA